MGKLSYQISSTYNFYFQFLNIHMRIRVQSKYVCFLNRFVIVILHYKHTPSKDSFSTMYYYFGGTFCAGQKHTFTIYSCKHVIIIILIILMQ